MSNFAKISILLFLCAVFGQSLARPVADLKVSRAYLVLVDNSYYTLNTDAHIVLNEKLQQAINKGVELDFLVKFKLVIPRQYWLDDEIVTHNQRVTLHYHALMRRYLVIEDTQKQSFVSLDQALRHIASLRNIRVLEKNKIVPRAKYQAHLTLHSRHRMLSKQSELLHLDGLEPKPRAFVWLPHL